MTNADIPNDVAAAATTEPRESRGLKGHTLANSVHAVETSEPWRAVAGVSPSVDDILRAVGIVAYDWDVSSDEMTWDGETATVLHVPAEAISTGDAYSARLDASGPPGRREAVLNNPTTDDGKGVAYDLEYRILTGRRDEPVVRIQDIGRWYAGSDGRPVHAHGIVRAISGRRARDERLIDRSDRDDPAGGPNRVRLIEKREAAPCSHAAIASQIVSALNEGRMALALQPIVSAADNGVRFHEALCRINLDDGTQSTASDFIETAERLGIVRLVDNRSLDLAVAALLDDPELTLSVNVSASSALDGTWLSQVSAHLRRHRGLSERLIVEITETVAIHDIDRTVEFVRAIRALGCRVAIDDFGAGHTSFRNLRALGANIVKIDGSFVERISENDDDRFFVAALVSLAHRIGMTTVAERVAKEGDAQILRDLGVDYLQGHLFGVPRQSPRSSSHRKTAIG